MRDAVMYPIDKKWHMNLSRANINKMVMFAVQSERCFTCHIFAFLSTSDRFIILILKKIEVPVTNFSLIHI